MAGEGMLKRKVRQWWGKKFVAGSGRQGRGHVVGRVGITVLHFTLFSQQALLVG